MGLQDQLSEMVDTNLKKLQVALFGQNNERIDFLMDSFYKLAPQQRTGVLAGGVALVVFFILGAVGLYFSQARSLEHELSNSIAALQELKRYKAQDLDQDRRFTNLTGILRRKAIVNFKPFFEKMAQQKNVAITNISETSQSIPSNDPLSKDFSRANIDVSIEKISIPRLLDFVSEVEKAGNFVRLKDMKVSSQYGTRLYFTADLTFAGYKTN